MMFYNGFNLMIDIILVTIAVLYTRWSVMRDQKLVEFHQLDHEFNDGYNAGYATAMRMSNDPSEWQDWLLVCNCGCKGGEK